MPLFPDGGLPSLTSRVLIAGLVVAISICGCSHSPQLSEDFQRAYFTNFPSPNLRFDQSDMVLIGVVERVDALGAPRRAATKSIINSDVWIEPIRVRVRADTAFKRQPTFPIVDAYGYRFSQRNDRQLGHPLPFQPEPGQRLLLFLRLEGTRLRLLHDVFDYSLRVFSGEHKTLNARFASSPKMATSWILLTRGRDCRSEGFALYLGDYAWFADELVGTSTMVELLKDLLQDPSLRVRSEAEKLLRSFNADIKGGLDPFGGPPTPARVP